MRIINDVVDIWGIRALEHMKVNSMVSIFYPDL